MGKGKYNFYSDPETGEAHILKHRVSEEEAIEAFENKIEDRPAVGQARSRIGQTTSGRYLRVIYRVFPEQVLFITAYDLLGKPLKAFKRRRKK